MPPLQPLRDHPVIAAVMLLCALAGAIAGPLLLPESISDVRRVLGGAVSGAGIGLLLTAYRMIGE